MVVTVTHGGYVKRVPVSAYRAQRRGGKGRSGMATREDDFVSSLFVANTHTPMLFFSSRGIVYKLKVWRLPLGAPQARGKAFVNLLPLGEGETITTVMPMPEDEASWATLQRDVRHRARRRAPQRAQRLRQRQPERQDRHEVRGRRCRRPADRRRRLQRGAGRAAGDPRRAAPCASRSSTVRVFASRNSTGVRGIALAEGDEVISMSLVDAGKGIADRGARRLSAPVARAAPGRERRRERRGGSGGDGEEEPAAAATLSPERFDELQAKEEFVLTVASIGLRQAHLGLRVPGHRPRRQGRRADAPARRRPGRRGVPGGRERPDHAGHRWRHADPLSGGRNPHRGPRPRAACASSMSARASALCRRSASARTMPATATAMAKTIPKQTVDKDRPCR